jgi:hypothetical protein
VEFEDRMAAFLGILNALNNSIRTAAVVLIDDSPEARAVLRSLSRAVEQHSERLNALRFKK